ncbi:MAG TPA: HypC/HybG/HupF family hydrogenase formation chaperone [Patescibacteria group bacterium]
MCLAYPGLVKEISGLKATIQYPSGTRQALVGDQKVKVGARVLVQMGIVVKVLSKKESNLITTAWDSINLS